MSDNGIISSQAMAQLRTRAEQLIRTGQMPSLEKLTAAILEARKKYAAKIRMARRNARNQIDK